MNKAVKIPNHRLASYEISLLINRGQKAFNELLKTCLGHHGLTVPTWALLGQLYKRGPMRPSEVAALLGIKPPFTTTLINALYVSRYITTEPFPDDERGKQIALTKSGRLMVEAVEKKLQICLDEQLGSLQKNDLSTYFEINEYLSENVRHHS